MFSLKDQFKTQPAHCNVSVDEIKASSCGIDFNGNKWDVPHDFELKTLKDTSSRPAYTCTAKLISRSLDSLWNNYELPEVKVFQFTICILVFRIFAVPLSHHKLDI